MKIKKILFSCLLCIVIPFNWASAERFSSSEDKARYGLAESLNNQKKYEQALPVLKELSQKYSEDKDLLMLLGDTYFEAEKNDQAFEVYNKIQDPDTVLQIKIIHTLIKAKREEEAKEKLLLIQAQELDNADHQLKLVELYIRFELYDQAINLCRLTLNSYSTNRDAKLWLARTLSWTKNYDESIQYYDELIEAFPSWKEAQREKARVLGWKNDYTQALKTYDSIAIESEESVEFNEKMAKKYYYAQKYMAAKEYYEKWIEQEPENLEALYELAQIESHNGQYINASRLYQEVLDQAPNHPQAVKAQEKANVLNNDVRVKSQIEFFEADSSSRANDKRYSKISIDVEIPINEKLNLELSENISHNKFSDFSDVNHNQIKIGARLKANEQWWGGVGYKYNNYSDDLDSTHRSFANLNYKPLDILKFRLLFDQEDVIENSTTLINGLHRTNYQLSGRVKITRRLESTTTYTYGDYSDGNDKKSIQFESQYHLFFDPKRLTLGHRYENYNFAKTQIDYFSPNSFHYNEIYLQWQQHLSKQTRFWGSDETYYMFHYGVNFDVGANRGHNFAFKLYHDFNSTASCGLDWSKKIYEHKSIYSEDKLTLTGKILF